MTDALPPLQVSLRYDREHSSAVWKRLEAFVRLRVQPDRSSAGPLRHTPASRSVCVFILRTVKSVSSGFVGTFPALNISS